MRWRRFLTNVVILALILASVLRYFDINFISLPSSWWTQSKERHYIRIPIYFDIMTFVISIQFNTSHITFFENNSFCMTVFYNIHIQPALKIHLLVKCFATLNVIFVMSCHVMSCHWLNPPWWCTVNFYQQISLLLQIKETLSKLNQDNACLLAASCANWLGQTLCNSVFFEWRYGYRTVSIELVV